MKIKDIKIEDWATEECLLFCKEHNLKYDLIKCKSALDIFFTNIISSKAEVDYWPEGGDDAGHIVIRLEIKSDRRTYRKEYNAWVHWMVRNVSDESRMRICTSIDRICEDPIVKKKTISLEYSCKRILFRMWYRVDNGQFDARSFVGDIALDLRDAIYDNNEELFWEEYNIFKKNEDKNESEKI